MSDIVLEKNNNIAVLTLNRGNTMNALCRDFIMEINKALDEVESDDDIYVLIITGTENTFISGADISEMVDMTSDEILSWSGFGSKLNIRLEKMSIPIIAAINGYALGGGLELAMACDIRLASENARLGLPEVSLGVMCGAGGTVRLPAIVGQSIAREMLYTGKIIDSREALKIGLVNQVFSHDNLLKEALNLAEKITRKGQLAIKSVKKALTTNPMSTDPYYNERKIFSQLFDTEDQKIGMNGFLSKEKNIKFKNR